MALKQGKYGTIHRGNELIKNIYFSVPMATKQPVKEYINRKKAPVNTRLTCTEALRRFPDLSQKLQLSPQTLSLLVKSKVLIGSYKLDEKGSQHKLYIEIYSIHRLIDFISSNIDTTKPRKK